MTSFTDFSLNLVRKTGDFSVKSNLVRNLAEFEKNFDNINSKKCGHVICQTIFVFLGRAGSKGKSKGKMRFNFYDRKVTLIRRHRYPGLEKEGFS